VSFLVGHSQNQMGRRFPAQIGVELGEMIMRPFDELPVTMCVDHGTATASDDQSRFLTVDS
jgi:hypothetical protein